MKFCTVHNRGDPMCKKQPVFPIRVKVFHPESGRKTWQTWFFCQDHYNLLLQTKGKGWYSWYGGKKRMDSPVIEIEKVIEVWK